MSQQPDLPSDTFIAFLTCSHSLINVPMVVLYVGEPKSTLYVHRDLICNASPVFASAFLGSGGFIESTEQSMTLTDEDVGTVARFSQWLYTGDYDLVGYDNFRDTQARYMQLAKLYVFADKYDVINLQNNITGKLFRFQKKRSEGAKLDVVNYVYEHTAANCAFRQLLVADDVWNAGPDWYMRPATHERLSESSHEYAIDLALAFAKKCHDEFRSPFDGPVDAFYKPAKPSVRNTVVEKVGSGTREGDAKAAS